MDRLQKKISLKIESLDLEWSIYLDWADKIKKKVEHLLNHSKKSLSNKNIKNGDQVIGKLDTYLKELENVNSYLSASYFANDSSDDSQNGKSDDQEASPSPAVSLDVMSSQNSLSSMSSKISVDPISQHGEVRPDMFYDVKVIHVVDPGCFYLCLTPWNQPYDEMCRELRSYCTDQKGVVVSSVTPDQIYGVLYSDKDWHRCKVKSTNGKSVTVQFIDYGNELSCDLACLIPLPPALANLLPFAICCTLRNVKPSQGSRWTSEEVSIFKKMVEHQDFKAKFPPPLNTNHYNVDLFTVEFSGGRIKNKVCKLFSTEVEKTLKTSQPNLQPKPAEKISVSHTSSTSSLCSTVVCKSLPTYPMNKTQGTAYTVQVSHAYSHDDFYVHIIDALTAKIDHITSTMDAEFKDNNDTQTVDVSLLKLGTYWSALYSKTNQYYRAKILSVKQEPSLEIHVQYIDYGNNEVIPLSSLQPLPMSCMNVPPLSIPCKLGEIQATDFQKCKTRFLSLIDFDKELVMVVLESNNQERIPVILIEEDAAANTAVFLNALLVDEETAKSDLFGEILSSDGKVLKGAELLDK